MAIHSSTALSLDIIIGFVVGGVCFFCFARFLLYLYKDKLIRLSGTEQHSSTVVIHPRHLGSDQDAVMVVDGGGTTSENLNLGSSGRKDMHMIDAGNMAIQFLRNVTNNFSQDNIVGKGGFGTVYSGELPDGTKIAVKRMESGGMSEKVLDEFKFEINVLTKVRHRNLVVLLGYCLDGNERLIVYEYMAQGTLSRYLFDWNEKGLKPLEWTKRLTIALDVARGVEYLHGMTQQSFIHRDLKPSNILLGDDMRAKVADFGHVRLAPDGRTSLITRLAGTFGYVAPEYAVTGRVTTKIDVFSFGVILMELITGRRAIDESQDEDDVHIVPWFCRMHLSKEKFQKAIDPFIDLSEDVLASINTISDLACHCCAREPLQRPDMSHAVHVLASLAELWMPSDTDPNDEISEIHIDMTLPEALKMWQAREGMDYSSSGIGSSTDHIP